jgi:hypothetical protein
MVLIYMVYPFGFLPSKIALGKKLNSLKFLGLDAWPLLLYKRLYNVILGTPILLQCSQHPYVNTDGRLFGLLGATADDLLAATLVILCYFIQNYQT